MSVEIRDQELIYPSVEISVGKCGRRIESQEVERERILAGLNGRPGVGKGFVEDTRSHGSLSFLGPAHSEVPCPRAMVSVSVGVPRAPRRTPDSDAVSVPPVSHHDTQAISSFSL